MIASPRLVLAGVLLSLTACPRGAEPPAPASGSPDRAMLAPYEHAFLTGGAKPADELPLVVLLHGLGDTPSGIAPLLEELGRPARVLALAAPSRHGPGYSWFDVRARGSAVEALAGELAAAADRLGARVERLARARGRSGVFVTGFSQGGMLAFALAVRRPDLVHAAVPIGGLLPPALWPEAAPPDAPAIHAFHGAEDEVVPTEGARATVEALVAAGWDARLEVEPGLGHGISASLREAALAALRDALGPEGNGATPLSPEAADTR